MVSYSAETPSDVNVVKKGTTGGNSQCQSGNAEENGQESFSNRTEPAQNQVANSPAA